MLAQTAAAQFSDQNKPCFSEPRADYRERMQGLAVHLQGRLSTAEGFQLPLQYSSINLVVWGNLGKRPTVSPRF